MEAVKQATCRHCGKLLVGIAYELGGPAYHPETGRPCKVNHYGGFVCSESCDIQICTDVEALPLPNLSPNAARSLANNWGCL